MFNKLPILLTGSGRGYNPNRGEPYHVVWNPQVIYNNKSDYIFPSTEVAGYFGQVNSTAVLTDYDYPEVYPYMLSAAQDPVSIDWQIPYFNPTTANNSKPLYRMPRIQDIANMDRRGKLPKVFQLRFRSSIEGLVNLFTINLNKSGTRYIKLQHLQLPNEDPILSIALCLDGGVVHQTAGDKRYTPNPANAWSETIRLAVFDNKVSIYYGDPPVEIETINTNMPVISDDDAELLIMDYIDNSGQYGVKLGFDGLIIYDGYF